MVINFSDLCAVALGCIRASMYRVNRAEDEGLNFWSRPSVSLGAHLTIQVYGDCTTRMLLPSSRTLHCIRACCLPLSPKLSLSLSVSLSLSLCHSSSLYLYTLQGEQLPSATLGRVLDPPAAAV